MTVNSEDDLEPVRPLESECCGSGCNPCILDIYQQELTLARKVAAPSSSLNTDSYTEFCLTQIVQHTCSTNVYRFKLDSDNKLGHNAGQHVIIKQPHPCLPGRSVTRQYSVLSDPLQTGHFDLLIKIYKHGVMSSVIRHWKVGDLIPMRGPFGGLDIGELKQNLSGKQVVYICQGTGLVPVLSVLQQDLQDEDCCHNIHLFYSVHSTQEILMQNEIFQLCDYWNFRLTIFISETVAKGFKLYGPNKSYVNEKLSEKYLDFDTIDKSIFVLCGSKEFMKNVQEILKEKGAKNILRF